MNNQRSGPSKQTLLIVVLISFIAISLFGFSFSTSGPPKPELGNTKMGIVHVVMFQFKEEATADDITDVCTRMLALKDQCLHPTSKKPYIRSGIGGKENSVEGLAGGMTHIFVVELENEEDRTYYLEKDPAHLAFVQSIGKVVEKVQVVDFAPGVF